MFSATVQIRSDRTCNRRESNRPELPQAFYRIYCNFSSPAVPTSTVDFPPERAIHATTACLPAALRVSGDAYVERAQKIN